jgi:hypothetical protein
MCSDDTGFAWAEKRSNDVGVGAGHSRWQDTFSRADIYQER